MFTNTSPGTEGPTYNGMFSSTCIGAVIAYNFIEHHLDKVFCVLNKIKPAPDDLVMIVVGEVDCRWHIPRRASLNNENIEDVVADCATRFFRSILKLRETGYNVLVWYGHPSTIEGHNDDPSCPVWGDCEFRNSISLSWMCHLIRLSKLHGFPYIGLVEELIQDNGITEMRYFTDYCHLKSDLALPLVIDKLKRISN